MNETWTEFVEENNEVYKLFLAWREMEDLKKRLDPSHPETSQVFWQKIEEIKKQSHWDDLLFDSDVIIRKSLAKKIYDYSISTGNIYAVGNYYEDLVEKMRLEVMEKRGYKKSALE